MLSDDIKNIEINEQVLLFLKKQIINAERENLKTGSLSNSEMVKKIKKLIENQLI